jgi:hypothetical protein
MKKRAMCATLLALGTTAALGAPAASAGPGPCKGNDLHADFTVAPNGYWYLDDNGNGYLCYHDGGNSKKSKTAGSFWYDDRI